MLQGIDVSNYQGDVNWARVAADGITFAHGKASEGVSYKDPTFQRNRNAARAYAIHFGGYHFAHPSANPPKQEAAFFASVLGQLLAGELRPVLDLEAGSGDVTVWAGTFLAELERLTGVRPMWYSGKWFIGPHVNFKALSGYAYWDSSYGPNDGREHPAALPNVEHQYTSNGVIFGVIGHVDRNSAPSLTPLLASVKNNIFSGTPVPVGEPKNGLPFTRKLWPVPVPAWFWTWAQWRLDGQSYARPEDAPDFIPAWAWVRLKQL